MTRALQRRIGRALLETDEVLDSSLFEESESLGVMRGHLRDSMAIIRQRELASSGKKFLIA